MESLRPLASPDLSAATQLILAAGRLNPSDYFAILFKCCLKAVNGQSEVDSDEQASWVFSASG
jgi:hypothetical protein